MFFPVIVMAKFSIGKTFTMVVRIFTKLAFFNCACSISKGLISTF